MNARKFPEQLGRRGLRTVARHSLTVLLASTALGVVSARAQDATWVGNNVGDPNEWIENNNWTPATIPTGTATFTNNGAPTTVDADGIVSVNAITFTGAPNNAPAYTITMNDIFIVSGTGVTNNSTNTQTINNTVSAVFENSSSASAGTGPVTYNNSGGMSFQDTSTAGNAIIVNNGDVEFNISSTAGSAHITNNATLNFNDNATAGTANITNAVSGSSPSTSILRRARPRSSTTTRCSSPVQPPPARPTSPAPPVRRRVSATIPRPAARPSRCRAPPR